MIIQKITRMHFVPTLSKKAEDHFSWKKKFFEGPNGVLMGFSLQILKVACNFITIFNSEICLQITSLTGRGNYGFPRLSVKFTPSSIAKSDFNVNTEANLTRMHSSRPVGCVSPACWCIGRGWSASRGWVCIQGWVCILGGGGRICIHPGEGFCLGGSAWRGLHPGGLPRGSTPLGLHPGGVCIQGGICTGGLHPGGLRLRGSASRGGGLPKAVCLGRYVQPPQVCLWGVGQNPFPLWTEWHTGVKTLP